MINPMELSGKHILITGASSGIGRATCVLASNLGAKVTLVARNEKRLHDTVLSMEQGEHNYYCADLAQLSSINNLIKTIVAEQGKIDGFVHCAGISTGCPIRTTTSEFLDSVMKINLYAFVEFVRLLSSKRLSNNSASLVGVSSVAAFTGLPSQTAYSASKAALNGILGPAAKELALRRIRINTVAFSMINTDMYEYFKEIGGNEGEVVKRQYLGIGEVEDAANVIAFLLSNASKFITGSTIIADGGVLS